MALHQIQAATRSPGETRLRILAATRSLLAQKGRRGTTTREIADLAGVNEATIFRHFGVESRPELLSRWIRRAWNNGFAWADE